MVGREVGRAGELCVVMVVGVGHRRHGHLLAAQGATGKCDRGWRRDRGGRGAVERTLRLRLVRLVRLLLGQGWWQAGGEVVERFRVRVVVQARSGHGHRARLMMVEVVRGRGRAGKRVPGV